MEEVFESSCFKTTLLESGIIHTVVKDYAEVHLVDAIKNEELVRKAAHGINRPLLVDLAKIKTVDGEARSYFAMKGRESVVIALGIIVKSPVAKVIGNFFIGINHPQKPTKLFTSEKKAIVWLESFRIGQ